MIDEKRVEAAVDWLRESAEELAEARAHRHYLDKYEKHLVALVMAEHRESKLAEQEREARVDLRYSKWLSDYREAVKREEFLRAKREAAINLIEYWRSYSANTRGRL